MNKLDLNTVLVSKQELVEVLTKIIREKCCQEIDPNGPLGLLADNAPEEYECWVGKEVEITFQPKNKR